MPKFMDLLYLLNPQELQNLSCLFSQLVESYHHTKQLAECETKEDQRILKKELQKYKICEKYYNQIFAKDIYLDYLRDKTSDYPQKRSRNLLTLNNSSILSDTLKESSTVDNRIQVIINNDLLTQIDTLKTSLANLVTDHSNQLQIIQAKNNRISKLENECEFLKKQITELNTKLKLLSLYQNQLCQNKNFKHVTAIDAIYKSQHSKYVSEINLAASAIKYSIARSKLIVDIDNHITGGGGYTKFINWIESLAIKPKPLPDRFLILAFDNKQKSQKNYLDQGHNTKCTLLSENDIEQLFYLNNDMKNKLEEELKYFINEIINNLLVEKSQEINEIDQLINKQNNLTNKMKKCSQCLTLNIDNKKRNCPNCNAKLPMLTSINQISSF
ncbi:20025_t:CDS:2 [Racocetra persica]|uniref:20025_t:CDS:1 n=1 Tax=Racocetra persica TaxID=160502 RepID=A0ACA9KA20_9GLOM|nr:20025_t:CDS:2 [Racocetra persica]